MGSLKKAGILEEEGNYFEFNNRSLFTANNDNFGKMFWTMGTKSLEKFFESLNCMQPQSLLLTREVLKERAQLEVRVSALREKTMNGIDKLSQLKQERKIAEQHAEDINANKDFTETRTERKRVYERVEPGTFVTHCTPCDYTCHSSCGIPLSQDKEFCAAMRNGNCTVCPNRCFWNRHANDQYRVKFVTENVKKVYDAKKMKYLKAQEGKTKAETIIDGLQKEFDEGKKVVLTFVAEIQRSLERLSEIALKKDPMQQLDYLDLLIESEKSQAKPGFKERISSLQELRKRAEEINKMAKSGYNPWEEYQENQATREFFQQKHGIFS